MIFYVSCLQHVFWVRSYFMGACDIQVKSLLLLGVIGTLFAAEIDRHADVLITSLMQLARHDRVGQTCEICDLPILFSPRSVHSRLASVFFCFSDTAPEYRGTAAQLLGELTTKLPCSQTPIEVMKLLLALSLSVETVSEWLYKVCFCVFCLLYCCLEGPVLMTMFRAYLADVWRCLRGNGAAGPSFFRVRGHPCHE